MPGDPYDAFLEAALARLPAWALDKIANVAILVEDEADEATQEEMRLDSPLDLLGHYHGTPLTERSHDDPFRLPDRITLYRKPIEDESAVSGKSVEEIVYETLWHEVGHYLGLDEDEVMKREEELGFG